MQETQVLSLGQDDPLEKELAWQLTGKGKAIHSSILAWRIPWTADSGGATVHGVAKESDTTEQLNSSNNKLLFPQLLWGG